MYFRKFLWISLFSVIAPLTLVVSAFLLVKPFLIAEFAGQVLGDSASVSLLPQSQIPVPSFTSTLYSSDARAIILQKYLRRFRSPLEPHSQQIVEISDKYSLDYRLLVAIAQQESNLCKKIPDNSHNCWGFGIYGDKVTRFDGFPEALDTVARVLKRDYIDKGLDTPEKIMAKYTPPSVVIGGPWAAGVNQFLYELE